MNAHNDVAETLNKLADFAATRRPEDPLLGRSSCGTTASSPTRTSTTVDSTTPTPLRWRTSIWGRQRRPGQTLVRALSPDLERDGWESDRTILMFVTDDVPFLVDTVRMVLDRHGLGIHLLVHPMLGVERDAQHRITAFGRGLGTVEAWTLLEIDRCTRAARRAAGARSRRGDRRCATGGGRLRVDAAAAARPGRRRRAGGVAR